jgi:hypothetical protein
MLPDVATLATFTTLVYCQRYTTAAERRPPSSLFPLRKQGKIRED